MAIEFEKYALPQLWDTKGYVQLLRGLLPLGMIWVAEKFVTTQVIQDVIDGDTWQDTFTSEDEVRDAITSQGEASLFDNLLSCFASELERLEADAWRLVNSTDPGVATDLLDDWERVMGLPEGCLATSTLTLDERQRNAHAKLFDAYKTTTETFYEEYSASLGFDVTVNSSLASARVMGVSRMGDDDRMGGSSAYSLLEITVNAGDSDIAILQCALNAVKQAHVVIIWIDAR
jgi:uncharacterized protein YmfQ (DUF2313 family)